MRVAALLGRADLLRAWARADATASERLANLCGFHLESQALTLQLEPEQAQDASTVSQTESPERLDVKAPLQARVFQASIELKRVAEPSADQWTPLAPAELLPSSSAQVPPPLPLVRTPRLWPALQRSLSKTVRGDIDVDALLLRLSQGQRVDPLPFTRECAPATPLTVIWDDAERLMPYERDCVQILQLIGRLRGSDYTLYTRHESFGDWSRWDGRERTQQVRLTSVPKAAGGVVLLLSDLGALASSPWCEQQWLRRIRAWRSQGAQVVAWLPTLPGQVAAELARVAAVHHLSSAGGLRAQRKGWRDSEQRARAHQRMRQTYERLLALASCAVHVAPELLRALRVLDPDLRSQPAAEGLAWSAAEVGTSLLSRPLGPEIAPNYRRQFSKLAPTLQRSAIDTVQRQHAGRGRTTPAIEWLLWQTHANQAARSAETAAQVTAARELLSRLAQAGAGELPAEDLRAYARDIVHRLAGDQDWWRQQGDVGGALHRLTQSDQLPAGLEAAQALSGQADDTRRRVYLAQRGSGLWLMPEEHALPAGQRLCAAFAASELVVDRFAPAASGQSLTLSTRWRIGAQPIQLLKPMQAARVHTQEQCVHITEIPRPVWAQEFGRDGRGMYALSPPFGPQQERFAAQPAKDAGRGVSFVARGSSETTRHLSNTRDYPDLSHTIGVDEEFGVYLDIQLGEARQRFRWIAPGAFWIGSSKAERARILGRDLIRWSKHEAPRHRVQLTRGCWMADTPCTQAFWQTLMRNHPSQFKGDRHPVENVSWNDVQTALQELEALLPVGCSADLPSEAEWEYACRADTSTAFSCGDMLTAAQARFSGDDEFGRGGGDRGTVPVASYSANPWGLFDMHGNVSEWCRDGLRAYTDADKPDPEGPQGGAARAVRGGSGFMRAGICRSATRDALEPGNRDYALGFRLVLRSTSPVLLPEAEGRVRRDAGLASMERMPKTVRPNKSNEQ